MAVAGFPRSPSCPRDAGVRTRIAPALALPLLLAACATPAPPSRAPASRIERPSPPAGTAAKPRWQAAPVRADGAVVPGGRRHVVKRGETGIAIARAYAVPWSRIAEANRIGRDSLLEIGQPLFIPIGPATDRPRTAGRPSGAAAKPPASEPFTVEVDDLITGSAVARPRAVTPPAPAGVAMLPAMGWPVDGRVILSGFGPKPGGRVNDGITIKAQAGATVRAAADGQVIYVGDAIAGFGLMVLIRHGAPGPAAVVTAYGHLEDALVSRGQKVRRGEPIARAGQSGSATEPQLLFQVRQGRRAIDPRTLLKG